MLASDRAHEFLGVLYGDEPRRWRTTSRATIACASSSTRARGCASARPTTRWSSREKRGPAHAPDGFLPWFAHPKRRTSAATVVCGHWSTLELMLAPNVLMLDSGCLWGGTLTGGQAAGSSRVSGAVALAGAAKAVRIDASAARASSRRWPVARRQRRLRDAARPSAARSPHTRQNDSANDVSPTYAGAIDDARRRRAVADRHRLHVPFGFDDRLQQRALERQHVGAVGRRALRGRSRRRRRPRARAPSGG